MSLFWRKAYIKIEVKNDNLEQALRALKKKLQREGVFRLLKIKSHFEKPSERKKREKDEKVTVEKVALRTIVETVNASGKVYPEVEVKISPDISGEITELNVQEGDSVKKGQILARIYADIYALQRDEAASRVSQSSATVENSRAALEALRANYNQTKATYDRNKKLFDDKVISRAELEQVETAYKSAQANLNAAEQGLRGLQAGVKGSEVSL